MRRSLRAYRWCALVTARVVCCTRCVVCCTRCVVCCTRCVVCCARCVGASLSPRSRSRSASSSTSHRSRCTERHCSAHAITHAHTHTHAHAHENTLTRSRAGRACGRACVCARACVRLDSERATFSEDRQRSLARPPLPRRRRPRTHPTHVPVKRTPDRRADRVRRGVRHAMWCAQSSARGLAAQADRTRPSC